MALWKFTNKNKYGNLRSRIIYKPDGESLGFNPKGFGSFVHVQMFKYNYTHLFTPPGLVNLGGKRYIVPTWQEVLPETRLEDINWVKPKVKKQIKKETVIVINKSSSSDKVYTTKYFPNSGKYHCDCPGTWRTGGNCKHIKSLRIKIEK